MFAGKAIYILSKCFLILGQGNPSGDLETIARDCFRSFDGANQETRRDIAKLLGTLVAYTQQVNKTL